MNIYYKLFSLFLFVIFPLLATPLASAADHEHDPNTYTWQPELSKEGPVLVTVSLRTETAAVYRNGIRIGSCRVSTGRPGYKTPTGIFHILNKDAHHHSKKYGNAPMPYSERLTWDGVALHAGYIPDVTATSSHGCIHLPYDFAKKLFSITHNGTTVIVSDDAPDIFVSKGHRIGFRSGSSSEYVWNPQLSTSGPVSMIFSKKDKKIYIIRGGIVIGEAPVKTSMFSKHVSGTAAFVFAGWDVKNGKATSSWIQVSGNKSHHTDELSEWFKLDPRVQHVLQGLLVRGTNLIVTADSVSDRTYSGRGFSLLEGRKEAVED
jgi:hypothetical protein